MLRTDGQKSIDIKDSQFELVKSNSNQLEGNAEITTCENAMTEWRAGLIYEVIIQIVQLWSIAW